MQNENGKGPLPAASITVDITSEVRAALKEQYIQRINEIEAQKREAQNRISLLQQQMAELQVHVIQAEGSQAELGRLIEKLDLSVIPTSSNGGN